MKRSMIPRVSIIMPVFNGEIYLNTAIDSILTQTFKDFEFIIIYDKSSDRSLEIIQSYRDPRINLVINEERSGIAAVLNKGIKYSKGEYIARMDCDDVSFPKRLEKQILFLDQNPEIGICGTWAKTIEDDKNGFIKHPIKHQEIVVRMLFGNYTFVHPSIVFRKSIFLENNLWYNENIIAAEDYDLWERASRITLLANIPQNLMLYRLSSKTIEFIKRDEVGTSIIQKRLIGELVSQLSEKEWKLHRSLIDHTYMKSDEYLIEIDFWFDKLIALNKAKNRFDDKLLVSLLAFRWFLMCSKWPFIQLLMSRMFWNKLFKYACPLSFEQKIFIIKKVVIKKMEASKRSKV